MLLVSQSKTLIQHLMEEASQATSAQAWVGLG